MNIKEYTYGDGGPIIVWVTYESTVDEIIASISECDYTLVAVEVDDWFSDLSPWMSEELDDKFTGGARNTLDFLVKNILQKYKKLGRPIYIMGYSLAGLFALWALTKCDGFSGAISCSGALWYPGFVEYLENNTDTIRDKKIYLSVGGKEGNTKDKLMATVIDCTNSIRKILSRKNDVQFDMNPGGHFAKQGKRLAKGIKSIL